MFILRSKKLALSKKFFYLNQKYKKPTIPEMENYEQIRVAKQRLGN
jgi:hypothetical protein